MNFKLKQNVRVLTVDPGIMGTGWCLYPTITSQRPYSMPSCWGVLKSFEKNWQDKASDIWNQFDKLLGDRNVYQVVIEMPEIWTSGKSHASAVSGDLFKLQYLIGGFALLAVVNGNLQGQKAKPCMISPRDWKGQLPKEVVISRIKRLCPNICDAIENHEADAVGMGLALQGVL